MSLCTCPERARCQYHYCGKPADWSILTPRWRWVKTWPYGRLHFMCTPCRDYYFEAISKPLKGIDRPEGSDEDWKGSILDHLRHAAIAIAFEERDKHQPVRDEFYRPGDEKKFTPEQQKQIVTWRKGLREMRRARV